MNSKHKIILSVLFLALPFITITAQDKEEKRVTTVFKAYGMCGMCKTRIEKALNVKGVISGEWNVDTKMTKVIYKPDEISEEKIHQLIADVGHDTKMFKAKQEIYDRLPMCCYYRGETETDKHYLKGVVIEENNKGVLSPLIGANVYWLGTTIGASTDTSGTFEVEYDPNYKNLVISYVGYQPDTLSITSPDYLTVLIKAGKTLKEVQIIYRQKSRQISYMDPLKVEIMNEEELFKAACCNLSESFETNPSVDVSYADALTGTKQIQMLGLAGIYVQILQENMPGVRGLASGYGLTFIPGTWLNSVQVSKGASSVVNGYESIAGQINVELKKPEDSDKLFFNTYANQSGRTEMNLILTQKVSDKWATTLLLHGNMRPFKIDNNKDNFLDFPLSNQINAINRWKYDNSNGLVAQIGLKAMRDDKQGGETSFNPSLDKGTTNAYGLEIKTQRLEGWGKIGYVFPEMRYKSIGLQLSAVDHRQDSYFGLNDYNASQSTFYANLIYQSIIGNTDHKFRTGFSYLYDKYDEKLNLTNYARTENVPGVFFEYTYTNSNKFTLVAGLRTDYHNIFGTFVTPRVHLRYALTEKTVLRSSLGRGQRIANIFAENNAFFATSRKIQILSNSTNPVYGLNPETAWNAGINLTHDFRMNSMDGTISLDYYRTDFQNQVVPDLDNSPQEVLFYNLEGKSWSNSFQAEINYEPLKRLDVRLAYRWLDVKTTYKTGFFEKPLISQHRGFMNLAYETINDWKFDYTIQWYGKKRLPVTAANPENYQLPAYSPDFFLMNAQISKQLSERFEMYIGMENIADFKQPNPILASDQPFGDYFDSSIVWGPIFGRMVYLGLRYRIK